MALRLSSGAERRGSKLGREGKGPQKGGWGNEAEEGGVKRVMLSKLTL